MFMRLKKANRPEGRSRRRRQTVLAIEAMEGRTLLSAAAFQVTQDWGTGFGGQVTITNTTPAPVNNWTLAFDFDRSITSVWDGKIASHVGNHYVVTNVGWNASIAANGGTAEFGFNGAPGNVGTDHPSHYTLNGVALSNTPSLSVNDVTIHEGGSAGRTPMTFTVSLSAPSTSPVSVNYTTADASAKAGSDYQARSGTLTFLPGTLSQTVTIAINNDTTASPNETLSLNLSNPVGASLAKASGVGTIVDTVAPPNQPPVAGSVAAQTSAGSPVTINVLAHDSDPDGDTISLFSYAQGVHGTVTANTNGTLTYAPAAGYVGGDSFTYTISDGHGLTATAGVSILVTPPATAGAWPAHVFAPYVDMTLYPTFNLVSTAQAQGIKYFTLAFIVADPSNNAPSWGSYSSYDVNGGAFDLAIRSQVASLRTLGGDVMVSFGGANGQELAQSITSVPALTAAYEQVINAYGLTHIDFDIEGAAEADHASIDRRSQAIAAIQHDAASAGRTLDVAFTLPVLPLALRMTGSSSSSRR